MQHNFNHRRFFENQIPKLIIGAIILIILAIVSFLSSCNQQTEQTKKEDPKVRVQREVDSIAAPYIANDIGDIDIAISKIKDLNQSVDFRADVLNDLVRRFPEYINYGFSYYTLPNDCQQLKNKINDKHPQESLNIMNSEKYKACKAIQKQMSVDSIVTYKFKQRVELQKEYVRSKWKEYAAQIVYKQEILKQQQAQDQLDEAKKK
jgi:capsular polysaccharide biosynthesis protein